MTQIPAGDWQPDGGGWYRVHDVITFIPPPEPRSYRIAWITIPEITDALDKPPQRVVFDPPIPVRAPDDPKVAGIQRAVARLNTFEPRLGAARFLP